MLIKKGAEAVLKPVVFDGRGAVLKERARKNYRIEELDKKLRSQRTRAESKLTGEARRAGVKTPLIYFTDEKNFKIYFERVDGILLKDVFAKADKKTISETAEKWGAAVAKLHAAGIIHGDLTTSNLMACDGDLCFLDFGLSFFSNRDEDMAEDINLLRQALQLSESAELIWRQFVRGYTEHSKGDGIIKRAAEIASRGRYVKRKRLKITFSFKRKG